MLRAYFDESEPDKGPSDMCVAGYLFDAERLRVFNEKWHELLKHDALRDVGYTHAKDLIALQEEYKHVTRSQCDEIRKLVAPILRDCPLRGFVASASQGAFSRLAPPGWTAQDATPYSLCLLLAVVGVAKWCDRTDYNGDIVYEFDANHRDQEKANARLRELWEIPVARARLRLTRWGFTDDRQCFALQAADWIAWHFNKWHRETVTTPIREMLADLKVIISREDDPVEWGRIDDAALSRIFRRHASPDSLLRNMDQP